MTFAPGGDFAQLMTVVQSVLGALIPVLLSAAVVLFLYGVVKYVSAGGDVEKEKQGRKSMMYGLIGLFVFLAFWGLVEVIVSTFDVGEEVTTFGRPTDDFIEPQ